MSEEDDPKMDDDPRIAEWPWGTGFSQLPSAVISTVHHPLGSPSLADGEKTPRWVAGGIDPPWPHERNN
jgi:hypothetical protein